MTSFHRSLRELTQLDGAIATPTVAYPASRTFTGVIYDSYGLICRVAQRTRCGNNEWHPSDPETISIGMPMRTVQGRSLYLGHYTGHYGHFLLETLARLWPLHGGNMHANGYDKVVFHPFLHKTPSINKFSPAKMSLASFGIQAKDVVFVTEPLRFETLTVPSALLEINYVVDLGMASTYQNITQYCLSVGSSIPGFWRKFSGWKSEGPLRLYLSRRRAKGYHPMSNELQVERIFIDSGFKVLHPEHWRFEQQVALFQRAEVIAGVEGSALHNSVFMQPGKLVINIGTAREPSGDILNQRLCDSLSETISAHIPFRGTVLRGHKAVYDIDFIRRSLNGFI